jgi:hypothetical protein
LGLGSGIFIPRCGNSRNRPCDFMVTWSGSIHRPFPTHPTAPSTGPLPRHVYACPHWPWLPLALWLWPASMSEKCVGASCSSSPFVLRPRFCGEFRGRGRGRDANRIFRHVLSIGHGNRHRRRGCCDRCGDLLFHFVHECCRSREGGYSGRLSHVAWGSKVCSYSQLHLHLPQARPLQPR